VREENANKEGASSSPKGAADAKCSPRDRRDRTDGGIEKGGASTLGAWEVDTLKKGWAPLAPALQPALDLAMGTTPLQERVEILVDLATKMWVQRGAAGSTQVDDEEEQILRARCLVYVVFPPEGTMGKVGGAPPRQIRWRPEAAEEEGQPKRLDSCEDRREACSANDVGAARLRGVGEAKAEPQVRQPDEESDPLMYTAKPLDGVLIGCALFERLQQTTSERQANHRYASPASGADGVT